MKLTLYHGTDKKCAERIVVHGFKFKASDEHWLGNGVYFYLDSDLANWWTTKPSARFGSTINEPVVLTFEIEISSDKILDLRFLSGYRQCLDSYAEFEDAAFKSIRLGESIEKKRLRCSFFDYAFSALNLDCIIGNFILSKNVYLRDKPKELLAQLRRLDIPYAETQVCIKNGLDKGKVTEIRRVS